MQTISQNQTNTRTIDSQPKQQSQPQKYNFVNPTKDTKSHSTSSYPQKRAPLYISTNPPSSTTQPVCKYSFPNSPSLLHISQ